MRLAGFLCSSDRGAWWAIWSGEEQPHYSVGLDATEDEDLREVRTHLSWGEVAEADDRASLKLLACVVGHLSARALDPDGAEIH